MAIDRRIESLDPKVQPLCKEWLYLCQRLIDGNKHGKAIITETRRDIERQKEMVVQKLSSTMQSKHLDGLAWDFAIIENGAMVSDGEDWRYTLCGLVAKALGAHWPIHLADDRKDACHVELRG